MALLVYNSGPAATFSAAAYPSSTIKLLSNSSFPHRPSLSFSLVPLPHGRRNAHMARARKGLASRTRRLEKRGRDRGGASTEFEEEGLGVEKKGEIRGSSIELDGGGGSGREELMYSTGPPPVLPGEEPDFWEGSKWDALGFFVQYMWAFGIFFGVIACGFAVTTYNEGATDFKETPVYKESIQSRELLEQLDTSSSDVFEVNPTEVAPSLE